MIKVIMMVGISGSGKSFKSKILSQQYNAVILSSDVIRKQLFNDENDQTHNAEVFQNLHKRLKQNILKNKNVIIDATNLTIKSRKSIITAIKETKVPCSIEAVVMTKPFELCIKNDIKRSRTVGENVIFHQMKKFQIPFFEEGLDKIFLEGYSKKVNTTQEQIEGIINGMEGFNQETKYHKYDLYTHCLKTFSLLNEYTDNPCLLTAGLLHDIGKMLTKKQKEDGNCSYLGHEGVGTYQLLDELKIDTYESFRKTLDILFYVNYHMLPFDWKEEKTKEKYKQMFGKQKYDNLLLFNKCDKIASGINNPL